MRDIKFGNTESMSLEQMIVQVNQRRGVVANNYYKQIPLKTNYREG
jgi:hypothetical protein